jgi:hypothetical protein
MAHLSQCLLLNIEKNQECHIRKLGQNKIQGPTKGY